MARRWRTRAPYGSWLLGSPGQSPRAVRIRVQLLLTALLLVTNLVGAGVVVVIATVVLPLPPASGSFCLPLTGGKISAMELKAFAEHCAPWH